MKTLQLELVNCYGIRNLKQELDFSSCPVYAIYAANGTMKSSLAQTFADVSREEVSVDRVFSKRKTVRIIRADGNELRPENVVTVRPYDEIFGHSERTSTLLVDPALRKEYEDLHSGIDATKETFLSAMKKQSGSKKDLEREISAAFTTGDTQFYRALVRVKEEVVALKDAPLSNVPYDVVFDEKALAFLATKDFKSAVGEYVSKYNELLAKSTYFKRGIFSYYNASVIAKNLANNGFFDAKHTVTLNGKSQVQISTVKELEQLIAKEKEGITNDAQLRLKFAEIEKLLTANANVRDFNEFLQEREEVLPLLENVAAFKEEVWKAYFHSHQDLYLQLVEGYQAAEKRKGEIEEAAAQQRTQWEQVIEIFNRRFYVPFKVVAKNRVSVILGQAAMLSVGFEFDEGGDRAEVEKSALLKVLSTGEKKALYILNIIFEVEARRKAQQPTLFVVDDIADSFDYKNKYAIIEYLMEMSEVDCFRQIILTHNFDFFRTIESRFVNYDHCLMATKTTAGVALTKATGIKNVFGNDWLPNYFKEPRKRIGTIPFMRNIVEYTKGEKDPAFIKLTSLLHWKADTATITNRDLDDIYRQLFGSPEASAEPDLPVVSGILREANLCLAANDAANFENKIVLSIAIRLLAEQYMSRELNEPKFIAKIESNQTGRLLRRFKQKFPDRDEAREVLQRVILMTPESIHLNSFMYEPILDMSDAHLRRLCEDLVALMA
jgi:hypothetical protein